jgi:hypothetical protein
VNLILLMVQKTVASIMTRVNTYVMSMTTSLTGLKSTRESVRAPLDKYSKPGTIRERNL